MGLIGREIIQTRTYVDPTNPAPPALNYKFSFPITVFDAVRADIDDDGSETLTQVLERIFNALASKQTKIPAKSANNIVTYGGEAGVVSSIGISTSISWHPENWSHDKVPTERAVGELFQKFGLLDENGNPITDPDRFRIRWSDVIGRPQMYSGLGNNDDGFMTQAAVTKVIEQMKTEYSDAETGLGGRLDSLLDALTKHLNNSDNPHNLTPASIGAAPLDEFREHITDTNNPHHLTPDSIGLGNVDNTSDADKPISTATQAAIDELKELLNTMGEDANGFITKVEYDQPTGKFTATYNNGQKLVLFISIDSLIDDIRYDIDTKCLVCVDLGGHVSYVDLSDLYVRYLGSVSENITVEILDGSGTSVDNENGYSAITPDELETLWSTGELPGDWEDDSGDESGNPRQMNDSEVDTMWGGGTVSDSGQVILPFEEIKQSSVQAGWAHPDSTIPEEDTLDPVHGTGEHGTGRPGTYIIHATINPKSVTDLELADNAVITRVIQNKAVTTDKLDNFSVVTIKIDNGAVTTEKIANQAVVSSKIGDRAVLGKHIFSSISDNRVLIVGERGTDPYWGTIKSSMIENNAITDQSLAKDSVTTTKIKDGAVTKAKILDLNVTTEKLADKSVTHEKLANNVVDKNNIVSGVTLPGTPKVGTSPANDAIGNEITDAGWVLQRLKEYVATTDNIADRAVTGKKLFTSGIRHRVLGVLVANSDPTWTQVDQEMMANDSVGTSQIVDKSVTEVKLADKIISKDKLQENIIGEKQIEESAVTAKKIFKSDQANMVLAALSEDSHPQYSLVGRAMIAPNAIGGSVIEDRSVQLSKLENCNTPNMILGVKLSNTNPEWMKITNEMITNHTIALDKLVTCPFQDVVIGSVVENQAPAWVKINNRMIEDGAIRRETIGKGEVWGENIHEKAIESKHILDWTIKSNNIAPGAIGSTELFTSPYPNRILAVTTMPYSKPAWLQLTTDMIEDSAVTGHKMFRSIYENRVLAVTEVGNAPDYLKVTSDFIQDASIRSESLQKDIDLKGNPTISGDIELGASDHRIATTDWVQKTIRTDILNPETFTNMIETYMLKDHVVTGKKLFTSPIPYRLLGVTEPNGEVEYVEVEEAMIADGAVTKNKIERDLTLLGTPKIEIRPPADANDHNEYGHCAVDAQWVLDKIAELGVTGGGTGSTGGSTTPSGTIADNSIGTTKLQDRSVTGRKLFTSSTTDRLLGVIESNADPVYTQLTAGMVPNHLLTGKMLWKPDADNKVIVSTSKDGNAEWGTVDTDMITDKAVTSVKIGREEVKEENIGTEAVTKGKLKNAPIIDTTRLEDASVTNAKLADDAITADKIADNGILSENIQKDVVLKGSPTVEVNNTNYGERSLRNIIISQNKPTGGQPGDIWFEYV